MVMENRQGLTTEDILEKPWYKSILNLLIEFQDKEFQGGKGLKQIHFRYVLVKGYKKSDKKQVQNNIKVLKIFFGDRIDFLIEKGLIIPECITSKQNLTKFLNKLEKYPITAIEKIDSNSDVRYHIKKEFFNEMERRNNIYALNFFPQNQMISFNFGKNMEESHRIHTIYGLSDKTFQELFNDEDRKTVETYLKKIDTILDSIKDIRISRLDDEINRRLYIFYKSTKNDKIKNFIKTKSFLLINFFYNGIAKNEVISGNLDVLHSKNKFILTYIYGYYCYESEPFSIETRKNIEKFITVLDSIEEKEFCKVWNETFLGKNYNFTVADIEEILDWGWDNMDLFEMFFPVDMSYSRYDRYLGNPLGISKDAENDYPIYRKLFCINCTSDFNKQLNEESNEN